MKKVVLVNPPQIKFEVTKDPMPPLGLAMLAAVMEQKKMPVTIIDGYLHGYSWEELVEAVRKESPDIIGLTGTTWNRFDSFDTARHLKQAFPSVPIVYGGPHATFTAEDTLTNLPEIDIIVRGEGEVSFVDLVEALDKGTNLAEVKGIAFRENGKVVINPPSDWIMDLDELPMPARHLLDIPAYNEQLFGKKSTTVMSSRGCPVECVYCSTSKLWGKYYRCRSPKLIGDEIEHLVNTYGVEAIWFFDDTLTLRRDHINGLLHEIKTRKIDIIWYAEIRVNTVDKDLLQAMYDGGCRYVSFGVESGSEQVLKNIDKGINLQQVDRVVNWCKEIGIHTKAFFMFGLPGETVEEGTKTVNLIKKYKSKVDIIALAGGTSILPGTKMEIWSKEQGYFPKDFSWVKPYYNVQNPTIGRDPRLPTLIQPQMGYDEIRSLNFMVKDKLIPFDRIKKRIRKYYDPREIIKDCILVWSILKFKLKTKSR